MDNFFNKLESDQLNELSGALAKAQSEIQNAKKDVDNPFFKSKYADLSAIKDACQAALSKNNIAIIQKSTFINDSQWLITDLIHSSGQWVRSILPLRPVKNDPQGMGSAMTYARRYAWSAIVGVVTEEDDDGNAASHSEGKLTQVNKTSVEPEKKEDLRPAVFKNSEERMDFVAGAAKEIEALKSHEALSEWMGLNTLKLGALGEKQKKWVNEKLADARARLVQSSIPSVNGQHAGAVQ